MSKKKEEIGKCSGVILESEAKRRSAIMVRSLSMAFCILLSLVFVLPIAWMLLSAFKDTKEFLQVPPTLFPEHIDWNKVADVWNRGGLAKAYVNTTVLVFGKVIVCLVCCGLAGYVLSRLKPRGSVVVITVVFWSMMIPSNMGMVPLYITFVDMGMMDSYLPMWLMAGANSFYTLLFKSFFDGIPKSYIEAAWLDGASEIKIFGKVILPLSKAVFMSITIFTVTGSWGEFMWPLLLLNDSVKHPLALRVYNYVTEFTIDEYLMLLIFVALPPIIFFIFFQKYIMEGVSIGGVKG